MNPLVVLVVVLVIAPVRMPRARGRRQGRLRAGGSWKAVLQHQFLVFAAILGCAFGVLAGPIPDVASANLVIGLLLPPEQAEGESVRQGVTLAINRANQDSAPPVRVVVRGRMGQWGADAVEAARMVTDDGAMGLIAPPNGDATHVMLQVAGRTAVPVVSLCGDSSVTRTGVPWMVRVVPRTAEEARALFNGLQTAPTGQPKRCVALIPNGRAGRELTREFKKASEGTRFVFEKCFELKGPDGTIEPIRTQLLKARADLVLIWLDPIPAAAAVKALRAAGFGGTLAGPGRLGSTSFAASSGSDSEGFITTASELDRGSEEGFRTFASDFRNRFGCEPDPIATVSYDAATLLIHILKTTGREAPRAFPLQFSLPSVSGMMSFDSEGNRKVQLQLLVAHEGRFIPFRKGQ